MNCPVPTTAWSPAFLVSISLIFRVDYTCSLPSVRQWEMQDCFSHCIVVSFSTTCKHISSHISSDDSSCMSFFVSCPWWLPLFAKCIWGQEVLCLKFWCVMGCIHQCQRQSDPAATSTRQFITFAHRSQPCNPSLSKTLQFFPMKIVAKKKRKSYARYTVDWCFHALLNTLPWI